MHSVKNWALGLLAAAAVASAADSDVTQLKKDSFAEFITTNDIVLAEFFAPWWYVDCIMLPSLWLPHSLTRFSATVATAKPLPRNTRRPLPP